MKALYRDSQEVTIIEHKDRGWAYVEFADGMERNVRTSELVIIEEVKKDYTLAEAIAESESFPLESKIRTCGSSQYNPEHYVKAKSANGNFTLHNGDPVAQKMAAMTIDEIYEFAASYIPTMLPDELKAKYGHLNPGMQRMNLGNRVRAAIKKIMQA